MFSIFWSYLPVLQSGNSDITDEKMEELRMLSGFKPKEIVRIRSLFVKLTETREVITRDEFLKINCIAMNPLKERICVCFGFDKEVSSLNFDDFLRGLALFNSPGKREQKLRLAFKIQDYDGDGVISKADMTSYIKDITSITVNKMTEESVESVVAEVFRESASDAKQEIINFSDFQRVVAPLDFQARLLLPI